MRLWPIFNTFRKPKEGTIAAASDTDGYPLKYPLPGTSHAASSMMSSPPRLTRRAILEHVVTGHLEGVIAIDINRAELAPLDFFQNPGVRREPAEHMHRAEI